MSDPAYGAAYANTPAENYERYFVPAIAMPVAEDLVQAAALRPGERVLDVACGTGAVTRLAAEALGPEGTVAGLDPNPAMLAVARQAAPSGTSIAWYEAPAEAIPLPDENFDVALCGMGLQFFSDRRSGLREIRRVLVSGGRFVANLPGPTPPPLEIMAEELARHVGPECASFVHLVFSLHDADELRALASDAGFDDVDVRSTPKDLHLPPPGDFLWQYVRSTPLAAAVAEIDEERRAALERDFTARCRDSLESGPLTGSVGMTTLIAMK
ncbi:MAG: methyltransferase domain-containing protein [Gemmatimonadota bacterium]